MGIIRYLSSSNVEFYCNSFICLLTLFSNFFLGRKILSGYGLFTSVLIGVGFNATVVTLLISFAAAFAKYYIFSMLGLSIVLASFDFHSFAKHFSTFKLKHKDLFIALVATTAAIASLDFIYLNSLQTASENEIIFNGHQNYFSSITLEIFKADYIQRLRVFDNYPMTWTKYHFFNGSMISIAISIFNEKNYLTFMAGKIAILALFCGVAIEQLQKRAGVLKIFVLALLTLFCMLTVFPYHTWWAVFTNSFTSIFFLILTLDLLRRKQIKLAIFFVCCFALSTSRSLIPGLLILSVILYSSLREAQINSDSTKSIFTQLREFYSQNILFLTSILTILTAMAAMALLGKANSDPLKVGIGNYFSEGWLVLMSPTVIKSVAMVGVTEDSAIRPSTAMHFVWVTLMLTLATYKKVIRLDEKPADLIAQDCQSFLFFLPVLLIFFWLDSYFEILNLKSDIILQYYIIPTVAACSLIPKSIKTYVYFYCGTSFIQIFLIKEEISFPNFAIVEWITLYAIIFHMAKLYKNSVLSLLLLLCILISGLMFGPIPFHLKNLFAPNNLDSSTKTLIVDPITSAEIKRNKDDIWCFTDNNSSSLAAMYGRRSSFDERKSDRYSMSKRFVDNRSQDLLLIAKLCPATAEYPLK